MKPYTVLNEVRWRNHCDHVVQDVWVFFDKASQLLLAYFLKFLKVFFRHAVPLLWLSTVTVVDREEHQVFVVPAKSSVFHSYVEPRHIYTTNVMFSRKLHQTVGCIWQVV